MFDIEKSLLLDIEQLDFVKQQIDFYPHELIGRIITISTKGEPEFTASFRISSASTHRFTDEDGDKKLGWTVDLNLESNVVRQWSKFEYTEDHIKELLVFDVSLYIRRKECRELELSIVERNIFTNQFKLLRSNVLAGYTIT